MSLLPNKKCSTYNRRAYTAALVLVSVSTVTAAGVSAEDAVTTPLTQALPSAERGQRVFLDRKLGHCLLCHSVSSLDEYSQGNIGPSLDGIGNRLSGGQLRLRLIDSTRVNPATAMPAYHRVTDLAQVDPLYADKPVLSALEIEDLIAYLQTLKNSAGSE